MKIWKPLHSKEKGHKENGVRSRGCTALPPGGAFHGFAGEPVSSSGSGCSSSGSGCSSGGSGCSSGATFWSPACWAPFSRRAGGVWRQWVWTHCCSTSRRRGSAVVVSAMFTCLFLLCAQTLSLSTTWTLAGPETLDPPAPTGSFSH